MNVRSFPIKLAAALLLMFVCLLAIVGIKASAASGIQRVSLEFDEPTDGQTVDFTPTITEGTGFTVTSSASETYNYYDVDNERTFPHTFTNGVSWYNITDSKNETKTSKYAVNHEYSLLVKLKANSGYYFDDMSHYFTINGHSVGAIFGNYNSYGATTIILQYTFEYFDCEQFDLWIGGENPVRINEKNAADPLGNGIFSYDYKNRILHLKGGIFSGDDNFGIKSEITDLIISVDEQTTLKNCHGAILLDARATITGPGKLWIYDGRGYGIGTSSSLTIANANLDIYMPEPIHGDYNTYDDEYYSSLTIDNSDITAATAEYDYAAIGYFGSGITLKNYTMSTPANGRVELCSVQVSEDYYDGDYRIVKSNGDDATKVVLKKKGKYIGYCKITIPYASYTYRGRGIVPTVTVKDGSTKLVKGTDYTLTYKDNINVGTATIVVKGKGKYVNSFNKTFKVKALGLTSSYAKLTIPYSAYTYTGSQIKPAVKLAFSSDGTVISTDNYTCTYTDNIKVGVATITINGKGKNVTGTTTKTFVVKPAKNEITSITTTSGAFTIKWKKGTAGTVGYQVLYCQDKSALSSATGEVANSNAKKYVHSYTSTNLNDLTEKFSKYPSSGETWYVKVRSFYTKDGKTTSTRYGNYSDIKSIKVK